MTEDKLTVVCDGSSLKPEDVVAVARQNAHVELSEEARTNIRTARSRVKEIIETGEVAYGLNTGFGELVNERIPPDDVGQLQINLLRSHASGTGRVLTRAEVRALLLTRINALAVGHSGIREHIVDQLINMLNKGVHPVVRSRGSLGASGDLAPLAHASLVLIGEGKAVVDTEDSHPQPAKTAAQYSGEEALNRVDLDPVTLTAKEGLALINGTQLTVGLASLFIVDAERLLDAADAAGSLSLEVSMGTDMIAEPPIHEARPHPGQLTTAENIRSMTKESEIIRSHQDCDRVQDPYSVRCIPQVHGAVRDAVSHLRSAVETELNSSTDNPLIFDGKHVDSRAVGTETACVVSGGNFHGEPLALRLDYVINGITELAAISERRIDRLLNPNIQESHLPPFLTPQSGLRSGYMIAQYTAAAMVNEIRSIGQASTDTIPVSGNQEDHVSMSAQCAINARQAAECLSTVIAVELLCASQAAEFVDDELGKHGLGTEAVYELVRTVAEPLRDDRPLHNEIERVQNIITSGLIEEELDII